MDLKAIDRINQLARKSKGTGLTWEEKEEQARLRREYLAAIRGNLRAQLDRIDVREPDGSVVNLGEKARKASVKEGTVGVHVERKARRNYGGKESNPETNLRQEGGNHSGTD